MSYFKKLGRFLKSNTRGRGRITNVGFKKNNKAPRTKNKISRFIWKVYIFSNVKLQRKICSTLKLLFLSKSIPKIHTQNDYETFCNFNNTFLSHSPHEVPIQELMCAVWGGMLRGQRNYAPPPEYATAPLDCYNLQRKLEMGTPVVKALNCEVLCQRPFPKGKFPSDNFLAGNFPNVLFPNWGNFSNISFTLRQIRIGIQW